MPEELLARLQNLESSYYGDKEKARQQQFFDTYGGRFSNNRGLGLAILNELDARGIDTSAADEAVQQILDELRTQCNEIIESIKDVQEEAIKNAQKVEAVANVVDQAVASNPDVSGTPMVEADEMPPETETPALDAMNPEGEFNPDEVPAEGMNEGEGEGEFNPAEDESEGTDETEPAPAPEEQPAPVPGQVTSDIRMKRIKHMKDHWGKTHAQKKADEDSYKPSSGILSACGGNKC